MKTGIFKQLDVLGGGLRLNFTERRLKGVIRFNQEDLKLQIYTGEKDLDGNEWIDLITKIASENTAGNIKIGNNLFVTSDGRLNAISVGPSMFYQHIVTVSKYDVQFDQHVNTQLPNDVLVKGGSGDFRTISGALNFIKDVTNLEEYPRNKENQWLILVTPGTYKENFSLLPFISIKGYGKKTTILEPDNTNSEPHIKMTTDSSLFDLTINFSNDDNVLNKTLIELDAQSERNSIPTIDQIFNNQSLIKDVEINLSNVNDFCVGKIVSGHFNFEDSMINLIQDLYTENTLIKCFDLQGGTFLNILEGKFNFQVNNQDFIFCNSSESDVSIFNSFIDLNENISDEMSGNNTIIKSINSNVQVRNSQIKNYSFNGKIFKLEDGDVKFNTIDSSDIYDISFKDEIIIVKTKKDLDIEQKFQNVKGIKIKDENFKISHVRQEKNENNFEFYLTLDNNLVRTLGDLNGNNIKILNLNSVSNSYLRSQGNIIDCESDNFLIENNDVVKEQGDYNILGNSLVEFNNFNIVHVSKDKGDFNTLSQALMSLGKLDSNLKYLIKVHTGTYIEKNVISLEGLDNVSIIGDSKINTEILFNINL